MRQGKVFDNRLFDGCNNDRNFLRAFREGFNADYSSSPVKRLSPEEIKEYEKNLQRK